MAAPVIVWLRPGVGFTPAAAASFMRAEAGWGRQIRCNSTYRDYDKQMSMYIAWNRYVAGLGPYPGHSRAIHPDYSIHCRGAALDTPDWTVPGFIAHMALHGWIRTAAGDPTEQHHFEYFQSEDRYLGQTAGSGGNAMSAPTPDQNAGAVWAWPVTRNGVKGRTLDEIVETRTTANKILELIQNIAVTVWNRPITRGGQERRILDEVLDANTNAIAANGKLDELVARAAAAGVTEEQINAIAIAVAAKIQVPTAAEIAKATNDDSAQRMRE